ncbi:SPOR domain-containing protein [Microbacteriaceae bacterium K1510]|nr:SPOR domain-containing protein [Microbacteriaceae bacterium K1510]
MADDYSQRPYRSSESIARAGQAKAPSAASGTDPLAELARLIGQSDPFGEFGRENARRAAEQQQAHIQQAEPTPVYTQAPAAAPVAPVEPYAAHEHQAYQDYATQPQQGYDPHEYAQTEQGYAQPDYDAAAYADHNATGFPQGAVPAYLTSGQYDPNNPPYSAEEQDFYDDAPPSKRRTSIVLVAGVFALAVVGAAGAFGYRAVFGSSSVSGPPPVIKAEASPSKVVPASAAKDAQSNKIITDRVGPQGEKLVSREEKPVDNVPVAPDSATGSASTEPKKVRTIAITPDSQGNPVVADAAPVSATNAPLALVPEQPMRQVQTQRVTTAAAPAQAVAEPTAPAARPAAPPRPAPPQQQVAAPAPAPAPSNAPLSLNPNAAPPARAQQPARTASVTPSQSAPSGGTAYAVQVTSQRSEAEAEAAFRTLVGKYGAQLGGKPHFIHRIDLGAKGTYYRALVGPYASGNEATELCSSLKAAGGQCIIQRN